MSQQNTGWFVYMVLTHKNTLYTGIATDVQRRFLEHCDVFKKKPGAKGAKYFRGFEPLKVAYVEACATRALASQRECAIKRLSRLKKTRLVCASAPEA